MIGNARTLSDLFADLTGIPLNPDLEELSRITGNLRADESEQDRAARVTTPNRPKADTDTLACTPERIRAALGTESVAALHWHYRMAVLVLVTTKGRRIGIPKPFLFSHRAGILKVLQVRKPN